MNRFPRTVFVRTVFVAALVAILFGGSLPTVHAQTARSAQYALAFNGVDDYVEAGNTTALEFTDGTVELWARPNAYNYNGAVVAMRENGSTRYSLHVNPTANTVGLWNGSAFSTVGVTMNASTWYHLAFVFDDSAPSTQVYVNGTLVGTIPSTLNSSNTGRPLIIGAAYAEDGTASEAFNGTIDEVRIWNDIRTQQEIQNSRSTTLNGSEDGLVAYYALEAGRGREAVDAANGNTGLLVNSPTWTSSRAPIAPPGRTIYVDATVRGGNRDGSTWADAYTSLQDALGAATSNDEVWIAQGTYTPGSNRGDSFTITGAQDGLKIYGGFEAGDAFADRHPGDHPVILSGDIGIAGDTADNSHHVLFFDGTTGGTITTETVLDGVTVTGGNANRPFPDDRGGGLYCNGRGAENECSPALRNVFFTENAAGTVGGGIFNAGTQGTSSPQITNATFVGNSADFNGGAIYNNGGTQGTSSPRITNSTFTGNSVGFSGGAIYNNGTQGMSSPRIANTILSGNTAGGLPDQVANSSGTPVFAHALVEGSGGSTNWDAALGTDAGGNLDADPLFADAADPDGTDDAFATADDGLRLFSGSPALNTGDNTVLPGGVPTDITGAARIQNGTVDLGAYEGRVPLPTVTITDGSSYVPPPFAPGTAHNPAGRVRLSADAFSASVTDLTLTTDGLNQGVSEVDLWLSADDAFDAMEDTRLAGQTLDPSTSTPATMAFAALSGFDATATPQYLFVTLDLTQEAGGDVAFSLASPGDIILPEGIIGNGDGDFPLPFSNLSAAPPLPVELTTFEAQATGEAIQLTWQTASEQNNTGFEVQRLSGSQWDGLTFVEGAGTTSEAQTYRFRDASLPFADSLVYRLKQIDADGNASFSPDVVVRRSPGTDGRLAAPFPNPARQQAIIRYVVPEGKGQTVRLEAYTLLGQRMATIVHESQEAGREEILLDTSRWASGTYFLRLHIGATMHTERLTVVR